MSEWGTLRQKAVAAFPEGEVLPPRRYMVAVLFADRDPNADLSHTDFRWIKAHSKISIAKIIDTYLSRTPEPDIEIWFNGAVLSPDTQMSQLSTFDQPVIALRAVEKRPLLSNTFPAPPHGSAPPHLLSAPAISFNANDGVPYTPISAVDDVRPPPLNSMQNMANQSVESSARPLHFARVNSSPLSDVPSSLGPAPSLNFPIHPASLLPGGLPQAGLQPVSDPLRLRSSRTRSLTPEDAPPSQKFDAEEIFAREPSPIEVEQQTQLVSHHIRKIIEHPQVDVLEAGVKQSLKILEGLKETCMPFAASSTSAQQWIESIDKAREPQQRSRTIIGVVGNTGAGKSSVINALLDEERLVPTNCMRACTAVVTEISWNTNDDPEHKYRAEIEFIDRHDWERDLKVLMQEFLTENGTLVREVSDPNSDAGVAWAKFHAVYPKVHRERLSGCTVDTLMNEIGTDVLGTTQKIRQSRCGPFYRELQKYVDSKEKATSMKDKKVMEPKRQPKDQMELWPLIKVVRLHIKSEALSTGAVIVDLPGVHDSNAARAAVAERYIQNCSALWIVAPITRAVDDKAAKTLMGDAFKRQLKYDGSYSHVTFICSKTDDISITEAIDSLELHDEVQELEANIHVYEQEVKMKEDKIKDLKDTAAVYRASFDEIDEEIETWEELEDKVETEVVFAPRGHQKRKRSDTKSHSRKRRQVDEDEDYDDEIEHVESGSDVSSHSDQESDADDFEASREPLTLHQVEEKLIELKDTKKKARRESKAADHAISELKPMIRSEKSKIADLKAQIRAICIEGRNKYSKGAIQIDFASGIKELDQEVAIEADETTFNPEQDIRDYDQIADSLPVFCVSSRAYQKMCGRHKKDDLVPGFRSLEETEVPQLKAFCKQLTVGGRVRASRVFLNNLCLTLTPLFLWAFNTAAALEMTDDDKRQQSKHLMKRLEELRKGLEHAVEECLTLIKSHLQKQVFVRMKELTNDAIQSAPEIASSWGRPRTEGGLLWATYKAVVRRGGTYQSPAAGPRDFNAELLNPITRKLVKGWERAFQDRLPKAFDSYTKKSANILNAFHDRVAERAQHTGVGLAGLTMLQGSMYTYEQKFHDLSDQLKVQMNEVRRDANRELVPVVAGEMHQVYDICANESGPGSFARMKNNMETFVQQHSRSGMFQHATQAVEHALRTMCDGFEQEMSKKVAEIHTAIHNDYMRVLGGADVSVDTDEPERVLRSEIAAQLKQIDAQFERISYGDISEEPDTTSNLNVDATATEANSDLERQLQLELTATQGTPDSLMDTTKEDATEAAANTTIEDEEDEEDESDLEL